MPVIESRIGDEGSFVRGGVCDGVPSRSAGFRFVCSDSQQRHKNVITAQVAILGQACQSQGWRDDFDRCDCCDVFRSDISWLYLHLVVKG